MAISSDRRLVTFDSEAYFLPCGVEQVHICDLQFNPNNVTLGDFRLRINGKETGNIDYEADVTDLDNNVLTALQAFDNNEYTVAIANGLVRITSRTQKFYRVGIVPRSIGRNSEYTLRLSASASGSFRMVVSGQQTATVAVSGITTNRIRNAITGLSGYKNSDITVTEVTANRVYTITFNIAQSNTISITNGSGVTIEQGQAGISPTELDDSDYRVIVQQQGSELLNLSADVMSMKFGRKVKTTETAGLSEIEDYPEVVGTSGTFSLSMYGTVVGDWLIPMSTEGLSGIIYWFPNGRVVGNTYTAMRVLLDGFDEDLPFHEKVEVAITGTRQGKFIAPTGTILQSRNIP